MTSIWQMDDVLEIQKLRARRYEDRRDAKMIEVGPDVTGRRRSRSPRRDLSSSVHLESDLRILSWNVDGLDSTTDEEEDMLGRTLWVVKVVNEMRPHVVLFQELVEFNFSILKQALGKAFHIFAQQVQNQPYFVATFVHKATIEIIGPSTRIPFPTSKMGREALSVSVKLKSAPESETVEVVTCHMESLREGSDERRHQLSILNSHVHRSLHGGIKSVIVAGDLNIRDNEVPTGWKEKDCWAIAGSNKDNEFTWDLTKNDNARMPNGSKPRCRFDRMYLFDSGDKVSSWYKVHSFQLVGMERIEGLDRFPSDHFGIFLTLRPRRS
jgi:exonuclease III